MRAPTDSRGPWAARCLAGGLLIILGAGCTGRPPGPGGSPSPRPSPAAGLSPGPPTAAPPGPAPAVPPGAPPPNLPTPAGLPPTPRESPGARPTAAFAPSPSPQPIARVAIGAYTGQQTSIGARLVGHVENQGAEPVGAIVVTCTLLDAAGAAVGEGRSLFAREVLPPGEKSPFLVQIDPEPPGWETDRCAVRAEPLGPRSAAITTQATDLTAEDVRLIAPADEFLGYSLSGVVRNRGTKPAADVEIIALLTDTDGGPVDVNETFSKQVQLDPGRTERFTIDFPFTKRGVDTFEIIVQGRARP